MCDWVFECVFFPFTYDFLFMKIGCGFQNIDMMWVFSYLAFSQSKIVAPKVFRDVTAESLL